jgi:hypothetical protein
MEPRTSVAIVANGGRTLSGFSRRGTLGQASQALDIANSRLWTVAESQEASVVVSVGGVTAEYASVWQTERALAAMFHEYVQACDPTRPAVASLDTLAVGLAPL